MTQLCQSNCGSRLSMMHAERVRHETRIRTLVIRDFLPTLSFPFANDGWTISVTSSDDFSDENRTLFVIISNDVVEKMSPCNKTIHVAYQPGQVRECTSRET